MKKAICLALAMSMVIGTMAFAAEQRVTFMRENEITLQNPPIKKNGKWMVSLEDLELLTGTQAVEGKDSIAFQKSVVLAGVELERNAAAYFQKDGTLLEEANGSYRKLNATEFRQGDILYLPCRDYVEAIGYDVQWFKWNGDCIMLHGREMPELTLKVEYDAKTNRIQGEIENQEPQAFLYGEEFTIERKTESGWEYVEEAEPRDINAVGYTMCAKREGNDGITRITYCMSTKLPTGEYRMGIPFSYTYYIQSMYTDYLNQKIKENDLNDIDWNYYYSTKWGKPDFYFDGAGVMSTTDLQRTTNYALYGTFTVE